MCVIRVVVVVAAAAAENVVVVASVVVSYTLAKFCSFVANEKVLLTIPVHYC